VETLGREVIGYGTYVAVDAKDFLDQNNCSARRAIAFGKICVKFVTIDSL
jgi:hypothetical protein